MQEKTRIKTKRLSIIFLSVMIFLVLMFFLNQMLAHLDPAKYNYMIERLTSDIPVDAYLHTTENIISLVWMSLLVVYLIVFLVFVIVSKNSMHLVLLLIGNCLFAGYTLTRVIFCFNAGSTSIIVGIFYLIAFLADLVMFYGILRRSLDGDALRFYYVAAIICFAAYFFASATKSSYSLLNAFGHMATIIDNQETMASHTVLDVVFWGGYATTRLFALTFAFILFGNMNFTFRPEAVLEEEQKPVETQN